MNWCPYRKMEHDLADDGDGNIVCRRIGCNHLSKVVCTCKLDESFTEFVGCPKHSQDPLAPWPRSMNEAYSVMDRFYPIEYGGSLVVQREIHRWADDGGRS